MNGKKILIIGIILSAIATFIIICYSGVIWLRIQHDKNAERSRILNSIEENGDFLYHVVRLNISGEEITNLTNDTECVESYIRIMGLSEDGKKKEIIIVPHYIDGIEVKEIGRDRSHFLSGTGIWHSDVLKKVYIPFQVVIWERVITNYEKTCPYLEKIIVLENELPTQRYNKINYIYITSFHHDASDNQLYGIYSKQCTIYCANVSYMYNYNDSPNHGYYWIDDYDYGTHITFIPDNPTREGYIFDGWYKEKECINKWDFETDVLPDIEYINPGYPEAKYQETILYAKWVKEDHE